MNLSDAQNNDQPHVEEGQAQNFFNYRAQLLNNIINNIVQQFQAKVMADGDLCLEGKKIFHLKDCPQKTTSLSSWQDKINQKIQCFSIL